jgi:hypothetical protein
MVFIEVGRIRTVDFQLCQLANEFRILRFRRRTQSPGARSIFQNHHPLQGRFTIATAAAVGEVYFAPFRRIVPSPWLLEHLVLTVETRTILEALLIEVEIKLRDARPN